MELKKERIFRFCQNIKKDWKYENDKRIDFEAQCNYEALPNKNYCENCFRRYICKHKNRESSDFIFDDYSYENEIIIYCKL